MSFWKMKFISFLLLLLVFSSTLFAQKANQESFKEKAEVLSNHIEKLAETVGKTVVKILVTSYAPGYEKGEPGMVKVKGSGSGVIIDPNGYIVTNAHVVEGAIKLKVQLSSLLNKEVAEFPMPGKIVDAKIVGINSLTDIALIKIEGTDFQYSEFGDSFDLHQGQMVFAFGSPLGLENTLTMGIVSTTRRFLSDDIPIGYIQTDAAINPGNSGGPLVNIEGKVIGINTMIFSQSGGYEGIGFAVPSNAAKYVSEQLREFGYLKIGMIGVNAQNIDATIAEGLQLPQGYGVILSDVFPGSPAQMAGLKEGDIILSADGNPITQIQQFNVNILLKRKGEKINFAVLRGSERFKLNVQIIERPDPTKLAEELMENQNLVISPLGISGIELNAKVRQLFPSTRKQNGVIVAAVMGNASGWRGGFKPGDIIYSMNRTPIYTMQSLTEFANNIKEGDPVVVHLERGGKLMYISFEMED